MTAKMHQSTYHGILVLILTFSSISQPSMQQEGCSTQYKSDFLLVVAELAKSGTFLEYTEKAIDAILQYAQQYEQTCTPKYNYMTLYLPDGKYHLEINYSLGSTPPISSLKVLQGVCKFIEGAEGGMDIHASKDCVAKLSITQGSWEVSVNKK